MFYHFDKSFNDLLVNANEIGRNLITEPTFKQQ